MGESVMWFPGSLDSVHRDLYYRGFNTFSKVEAAEVDAPKQRITAAAETITLKDSEKCRG
jgi:hypothetical protein